MFMNNLHTFFHKTIAIAKILRKDVLQDFSTEANQQQTDIHEAFSKHTQDLFQQSEHLALIRQILEVEQEKFSLRDTKLPEISKEILSNYATYNQNIDRLLSLSTNNLKEVILQQNPYIESYSTDWKFVFLNETDQENLFDKILKIPKDEYYFLFQRTDVFDHILQTNVMEFHLTKYEYYVLQLFQERNHVQNVMDEFIAVFEVETEAQLQTLMKEITRIVKFLIYRKFIVQN